MSQEDRDETTVKISGRDWLTIMGVLVVQSASILYGAWTYTTGNERRLAAVEATQIAMAKTLDRMEGLFLRDSILRDSRK